MTVKELASECNVHYNTMRKWLVDNKIKKENDTINSKFLITSEVIRSAKSYFLKEEFKNQESANIKDLLEQQITQKDIQIVKQQEQIEHLQKLLENQQILTLKTHESIKLLNNEKINREKSISKKNKIWNRILFFK